LNTNLIISAGTPLPFLKTNPGYGRLESGNFSDFLLFLATTGEFYTSPYQQMFTLSSL